MSCLEYCQKQKEARTNHEVTAFNEIAAASPLTTAWTAAATLDFTVTAGTTTTQTVEVPLIPSAHTINMSRFSFTGHNHTRGGWQGMDTTTTTTCPPGFMYSTATAACTPAGWRQPRGNHDFDGNGTVDLQMEYPHPDPPNYTFISQSYEDTGYEEFGTRNNRWKTVPHGPDQHLVAVKYYPDEPDRLRDRCCFQLPYDMFTWRQHVEVGPDRRVNSYRQLDENHRECKEKPTIKMRGAGWGTDLDFCDEHSQEAFRWHKEVIDNEIHYHDLLWTNQKANPYIFDTKQAAFDLEKQAREHARNVRLLQADTKADELLKKWLSPDEYKSLKENGVMEYHSKKDADTIYIIRKDYFRKVIKKVKGIETEELCVMPVTPLCNDDNLLSKIMLLKTDEEQFLKTANHFPLIERHGYRDYREPRLP